MKKIILLIFIILLAVGSYFGYKIYYPKYLHNQEVKKVDYSKLAKKLDFVLKKDIDKIKKDSKKLYLELKKKNDKLSKFDDKLLINPSAIKSIKEYKPDLFDIKDLGNNYLTSSALKNNETQASVLLKEDLKQIIDKAKEQNIILKVNSAYRSYDKQESIYKKSPDIASVGGKSEHQSGLAIDFSQEGEDIFLYSKAYKFLQEQAYKYGFVLSFAKNKQFNSGQNFEAWHWRYIGKEYASLYNEMNENNDMTMTEFIEKKFSSKYLVSNGKNYDSIEKLNDDYNISNILITKDDKPLISKNINESIKSSLFLNLLIMNDNNESMQLKSNDISLNEDLKTDKNYSPEEINEKTFLNNYYSFVNKKILNSGKLSQNGCIITGRNYYENSSNTCSIDAIKNLNKDNIYKQNIYNIDKLDISFLQYSNQNLSGYFIYDNKYKIIFNIKDSKNDVHDLLKYRIYVQNIIKLINENKIK